jgi:uncharacterized SAM-binding protein YcdF (DUF218 family)
MVGPRTQEYANAGSFVRECLVVSGVIVEVSARKISVPFECPCCGNEQPEGEFLATYTRTTGKRVVRETTRGFSFPCCTRCLAHVEMWQSADAITTGFVIGGIVFALIVGFAAGGIAGIVVFGLALVVGRVLASKRRQQAKASCGPGCVAPNSSIAYLGWSGSVSSFSFASAIYAGRFAQRNARALVNVNAELRQVLEHPALAAPPVARLMAPDPVLVPTASRSMSRQPGGDPVLDWIARIEGYKGPVARRNALERALQEVHDPDGKRRIVLAASRIEVGAVLDKVDSLASAAAKRRHLKKAIDDIRADNISDELQAAELQQLEDRLRSLGS